VVETAKGIQADHVIYLSQTQKAPTDPLDWSFKRRVCETAFKGVKISKDVKIRTPFQALEQLAEHYQNVTLVVGSDQVNEFADRMAPYAKLMNLNFNIVSAGQRVVESDDVDGLSASKMRQYAEEGNKVKFFAGLPTNIREDAKELIFKNTLNGMKRPK
jgi:anthranilate phosphoribosyltransferase